MEEWIETHGTEALKRAHREGYSVMKGIGDHLLDQLIESLDLECIEVWQDAEERTSPTADSFGKRDLVHACVKTLAVPEGWTVDVSRISRVTLEDDTKITGVLVTVFDVRRWVVRRAVFSFE